MAKYVKDLFVTSVVTVKVIDDEKELKKEFPLFAAVNRAASGMWCTALDKTMFSVSYI